MSTKVMQRIIGRTPTPQKAVLSGFHRYKIRDELYPAIAKKDGAEVHGMFITDLTQSELTLMDEWEDDEYERVEVEVEIQTTQEGCNATHVKKTYAYCWSSQSDHNKLHGTWQFEVDFMPIEQHFLDSNCP